MSLQVNGLNTVQTYSKPQMITTFKANPVATTSTLERTPVIDKLVKSKRNKAKKTLCVLGGICAVGVAGVLLHKIINKPTIEKAQKAFKEIFVRDDITLKETKEILTQYKEIEKITDNQEYIKKLFELAKKNFGLSHTNITIEIKDLGKGYIGASDAIGNLTISSKANRKGMVNFIHHELRHSKQHDIMISENVEKYAYNVFKRKSTIETFKQRGLYQPIYEAVKQAPTAKAMSEKQIDEVVISILAERYGDSMIAKFTEQGLGAIKYKNLDKEFVEKLFNASSNYNPTNIIKYHFNFLEKDARNAGETMQKLVKHFSK